METTFGLIVVLSLLAVILLVCWIVLPFAILGTKPLLREIICEQRKTNQALAELLKRPRT
jgi:hypothetical protein